VPARLAPRFFRSVAEFRRWLEANHARQPELLVGFYKKDSGRGGLTYAEALDEALCFGWIDGVRKSLGQDGYTIRFTPRRARSIWSQVNLRHMKRLLAAGRVRPPGRVAYEQRDEARTRRYAFERDAVAFDPAQRKAFASNRRAWAFFQAQPPSYRKTVTWWVVQARKEETQQRRLEALIACCARGERVPLLAPKAAPRSR
jgi:uncharacterized protein YdeI (YjbR/CyaY-like superfamily)